MATRTLTFALLAASCFASVICDANAAAPRDGAQQLLDMDRQADAAYREDRDADAERLYTTLARALPDEAPYWFRLGNVYARSGRDEEAVLAYRQTLKRQPGHARALHNLAVVRLRQAQVAYDASARAASPGDGVYEESRRMRAALQSAKPRDEKTATAAAAAAQPTQAQPTQAQTPPRGVVPVAVSAASPASALADDAQASAVADAGK